MRSQANLKATKRNQTMNNLTKTSRREMHTFQVAVDGETRSKKEKTKQAFEREMKGFTKK